MLRSFAFFFTRASQLSQVRKIDEKTTELSTYARGTDVTMTVIEFWLLLQRHRDVKIKRFLIENIIIAVYRFSKKYVNRVGVRFLNLTAVGLETHVLYEFRPCSPRW